MTVAGYWALAALLAGCAGLVPADRIRTRRLVLRALLGARGWQELARDRDLDASMLESLGYAELADWQERRADSCRARALSRLREARMLGWRG